MRVATLLVLFLAAPAALAQETGDCSPGTAHVVLDGSDVRASVYNTGRLFYDASTQPDDPPHFEVPKGGGVDAMFSSSLWVGGLAGGDPSSLRMAATTYGGADYWPGPLASSGGIPSTEDCAAADRIWHVTLEDVARYNDTGAATADLADWPVHLGAPVVDGDGIETNYDLAAGDRPAILGDESAWWVLNDRGNVHEWSGLAPAGLEVRVTAFTVSEPYARERLALGQFAGDVQRMVFVRHALTYQSEVPLADTYVGFHVDPDIGVFSDDHVGTVPEQDLVIAYNGTDIDTLYGASPPASALRILNGPSERALSGSLVPVSGSSLIGYLCAERGGRGHSAYRELQSLHCDGVPQTYGGDGYNPGATTFSAFAYPGLPPSYWSQRNTNGAGRTDRPADVRILASHGPFDMMAGETYTVDTAYLWARAAQGALASVNRLVLEAAPAAQTVPFTPDPDLATLRLGDLPGVVTTPADPVPGPGRNALASTAWPSPAIGVARLSLDLATEADVRLEVFDALGRRVAVPLDGVLGAGLYRPEVDVAGWPAGLYVYRLTLGGRPAGTGRLVVAR